MCEYIFLRYSNLHLQVVDYSRRNLMLFPYHLSDVVVKGLRITPFQVLRV